MSKQKEDQANSVKLGMALPVMEHFYTIQGEGAHTGVAAYFIRLGGCDVGCTWCDVKESWLAENHPIISIEEQVNWVLQTNAKNVVITGGEPAMYNLNLLTQSLQNSGLATWIETSGAHEITGSWNHVCLSPKKFKPTCESSYAKADELKVVVANRNDYKWAESHASKVNSKTKLFLQPEWSRTDKLLPGLIEYVKENPKWQISLQTHKYMNIP